MQSVPNAVIEIPAKTFLLGEYTATQGGPSLVCTTRPYFSLTAELTSHKPAPPFHPESPAGKWFSRHDALLAPYQFNFNNPYDIGGLGASTAEFLGLYLFILKCQNKAPPSDNQLLADYRAVCHQTGLPPSGADLLAQYHKGLCYSWPQQNQRKQLNWPFAKLSLLLFHSQTKLATHEHLAAQKADQDYSQLAKYSHMGCQALADKDESGFINAIEQFRQALSQLGLEAEHSKQFCHALNQHPAVLTSKGCGAMGADVILVIGLRAEQQQLICFGQSLGLRFIADQTEIARQGSHANLSQIYS